MSLGLDEANQGADGLTCVDHVAALGSVVAVASGASEVDDESFLREDLHLVNSLFLIILYYHKEGAFARLYKLN